MGQLGSSARLALLNALAVCAISAVLAAQADQVVSQQPKLGESVKVDRNVDKVISANWSSSCKCPSFTEIIFSSDSDGRVMNPVFTHYSSSDQYDAECLEALYSSSGKDLADLKDHIIRFGDKTGLQPKFNGNEVGEYIEAHKPRYSLEMRHPFVLVHWIPVSILNYYPGFFTQEQILNRKNLIELAVGDNGFLVTKEGTRGSFTPGYVSATEQLYSFWHDILSKPNIDKKDIEDGARLARQRFVSREQ